MGHFWLFCHKFTHFLVPLLQAKIVWWCPKIDKYEVRECKGTTGVCVFRNYEYECFQHWRISSGDWILPTGNSQYLKLTLTGC